MEGLEEKLGAILNDPQAMEKIMSMAKSLGSQEQAPAQNQAPPALPDFDPAMVQKLASLSRQGSIDRNQQALLRALSPYLSRQRIIKLENAMRAARMAGFAASALSAKSTQGR